MKIVFKTTSDEILWIKPQNLSHSVGEREGGVGGGRRGRGGGGGEGRRMSEDRKGKREG